MALQVWTENPDLRRFVMVHSFPVSRDFHGTENGKMNNFARKSERNGTFICVPGMHKPYFFSIVKYVTMNKCMTMNQVNKY